MTTAIFAYTISFMIALWCCRKDLKSIPASEIHQLAILLFLFGVYWIVYVLKVLLF